MAVAIAGPKFYAFDPDTGKPLAGGKLYTYKPGTTTDKATFTSREATAFNTNPVILNAGGYADIYLSGYYDLVLYDENDQEIWSVQNYSGSDAEVSFEAAKMYETVTIGLGATSVGDYFTTPSDDDGEILDLWFHESSNSAAFVDSLPSAYGIQYAMTFTEQQADRAENQANIAYDSSRLAESYKNSARDSALQLEEILDNQGVVLDFPLDLGFITETPAAASYDLGGL